MAKHGTKVGCRLVESREAAWSVWTLDLTTEPSRPRIGCVSGGGAAVARPNTGESWAPRLRDHPSLRKVEHNLRREHRAPLLAHAGNLEGELRPGLHEAHAYRCLVELGQLFDLVERV